MRRNDTVLLFLLCIVAIGVTIMISFRRNCEFDVLDVFADILKHDYWCGLTAEEVSKAETIQAALDAFDSHIMPNLTDRSERTINKLRSDIRLKKAWVYRIEGSSLKYCLLNLYPELDCDECGFYYRMVDLKRKSPEGSTLFMSSGYVRPEQPGNENVFTGCPLVYEASNDYHPSYRFEDSEIVAVVDVVDVELASVDGISDVHRYGMRTDRNEIYANYRIRMDVRFVEKGCFCANSFMLHIRESGSNLRLGGWLFYRGIALKVGLRKKGSSYEMVRCLPVLPYEPYSVEGISISGGLFQRYSDNESYAEVLSNPMSPLIVQYGNHTKVEFMHGELYRIGDDVSFPDFGVTSKFKVLELREGSNREYWEEAWFGE